MDRRLPVRSPLRHPPAGWVDSRPPQPTAFPAHPQTRSSRSAICRRPGVVEASGIDDDAVGNCCATDTLGCITITPGQERSASNVPTLATLHAACRSTGESTSAQNAGPVLPPSIVSAAFNNGFSVKTLARFLRWNAQANRWSDSHVLVRRNEYCGQRTVRAVERLRQHQRQCRQQPDCRLQARRHEFHRLPDNEHRLGQHTGFRGGTT